VNRRRIGYRLPPDTPADVAARKAQYAALELARADVRARYPEGINAGNAAEVLDYQEERINARIKAAGLGPR
jgi:hypothetical protein